MTDARSEQILDEWFGELDDEGQAPEAKQERWWKKDPDFDAYLRERYGADVDRALAGDYDHWQDTPRGALALVILLDQMTRNIHRGTGEMYVGDDAAVRVTERALERGFDQRLPRAQRHFLYMPLMHVEDLDRQNRCVELFERLAEESGSDFALNFAIRHRDIVARFGRFPHRNALLGRESTEEELAFLEEPGSSF